MAKRLPHFCSGPHTLNPTSEETLGHRTEKATTLGKPRGEGLTEKMSLTGGAEAEGGDGLLMGPDDIAAEACTHMEQPDYAPKACGCQQVPALLVARLGDHCEGCPGH